MHSIKADSGVLCKLLLVESMTFTTKSMLLANFFRVFDYSTVLAVGLDPDAQVTQHFKRGLQTEELRQAEVAVMIFSMYQIYVHSEAEDLPATFFASLLPLAFHGLHVGSLSGALDKRSLYFLSLMISRMIDNEDDLAQTPRVQYLVLHEFGLEAATHKVRSG
jgi:hypothetical protein